MYLLVWLISVLALQIPKQLPELFLVLISHEDPLQGHGAHLRPDAFAKLWTRSGTGQGPWESLATAFPIASAVPVSISTSPSSSSIPATCTPTAAAAPTAASPAAAAPAASPSARSGGKQRECGTREMRVKEEIGRK